MRFVKPDIHREIGYITQLAQNDFAICLCREGEPQPYRIIDTPETPP